MPVNDIRQHIYESGTRVLPSKNQLYNPCSGFTHYRNYRARKAGAEHGARKDLN